MDSFQAIVLGIVQGLTEFLPISSTGHLRIVPAFAGWDDPGSAFTAVVQLGTMAAVLLYFRHDLWRIAKAWLTSLRDPAVRSTLDARMGWYIILGTIPIGIFGLLFRHPIKNGARDLYLIGSALIVFGLIMLVAERMATQRRGIEDLDAPRRHRHRHRPGAGARAGRVALGRDDLGRPVPRPHREAAARYSFLLCIPAVVLSGLFELATSATAAVRAQARRSSPPCSRSSSATRRSLGCCGS